MKMKLILVFVILSSLGRLSAQQDPQWTNFMFDKLSFNPAYAGMSGSICGGLFFREQYVGVGSNGENPTTFMFNAHADLQDFNKALPLGVGLTFINDDLGGMKTNYLRLSFAYHLDLTERNIGRFSFGGSWGLVNAGVSNDWVAPDGQNTISSDNLISTDGLNGTGFTDFSAGVYYDYGKKAYAGVSLTHLTQQEVRVSGTDVADITWKSNVYVMGGYNFGFDNRDATGNSVLRSNVLVKSDMVETQFDVNVNYLWKQTLWGGITYRHQDAVSPMIGYQKTFKNSEKVDSKLKAGYSYGFITSDLRTDGNSSGSHEFFVTYCISIKPKVIKQFYRNPRMMINR